MLKKGDRVTLVNYEHVRGEVTAIHKRGKGNTCIEIKWSNGNVVEVSPLLADEIVRTL